jgi:hypothetical protein
MYICVNNGCIRFQNFQNKTKAIYSINWYFMSTFWPVNIAMIYPVPKNWPFLITENNNGSDLSSNSIVVVEYSMILFHITLFLCGLFSAVYAAVYFLVKLHISKLDDDDSNNKNNKMENKNRVIKNQAIIKWLPFKKEDCISATWFLSAACYGVVWASSTVLLLPTLGFVQHGWPVMSAHFICL